MRVGVVEHGNDERAVDLEGLDRQLRQIGQRRIAGAEIVDRDVRSRARGFLSFWMLSSMFSISSVSVISRSIPGATAPRLTACARVTTKSRLRSWIGDTLTATRGADDPGCASGDDRRSGLRHRPGARLEDQARLLHQRDELHRRHEPEFGALPADQRLYAQDAPRLRRPPSAGSAARTRRSRAPAGAWSPAVSFSARCVRPSRARGRHAARRFPWPS